MFLNLNHFSFTISELDEEECERRKNEFLDDMIDLERQFTDLKEQYVLTEHT